MRVKDLLAQQGLLKVLRDSKPKKMEDLDWKKLQERVMATICLCLANKAPLSRDGVDIFRGSMEETGQLIHVKIVDEQIVSEI